jgi:hypothetical protein
MISPSRALAVAAARLEGIRRRRQRFGQAGALEGQVDDLPLQVVGVPSAMNCMAIWLMPGTFLSKYFT